MRRRTYLSVAGTAGITSLAGCNSGWLTQQDKKSDPEARSTPEPTSTENTDSAKIIAEFAGRKSTVTDGFPSKSPLRFDIDFTGIAGFKAYLIDPNGEYDERLLIEVPQRRFYGTVHPSGDSEQSRPDEWAIQTEPVDKEGLEKQDLDWEITVWTPLITLADDD